MRTLGGGQPSPHYCDAVRFTRARLNGMMLSLGGRRGGSGILLKYKDPSLARMRSYTSDEYPLSQGSKQAGGANIRGDLGWEFEGRELFCTSH